MFEDEVPLGPPPDLPPDFPPDQPPDDWDHVPPPDFGAYNEVDEGLPPRTTTPIHPMRDRVVSNLRDVLSHVHEKPSDVVMALIERIQSSPRAIACLDERNMEIYAGVFEILLHECQVVEGSVLDLTHLPIALEYSTPVRIELSVIAGLAGNSTGEPHALWQALVESVQRHHTRDAALGLVKSIDDQQTVAQMLECFRKLEPPTTQKSLTKARPARTARTIVSEHKAALAGRAPMRFSSGMPTLDIGYTGQGEMPGFIAPGQLMIVMGPTGTGKSSFCYGITPAMIRDQRNYGLPDSKHVLFHTEEESIEKIEACRMAPGQPYADLADMFVVDAVGTSRTRIAETLYDLVIEADTSARATKRPITDFLPYVVQLDYIQSISEQGENEVVATSTTAELLLRGICAWNEEEINKFSGVNFREYAGMGWPEGMENHRVAVIAYAQLVKVGEDNEFYREGKSKVSDFVKYDNQDNPCWDVTEGDLRLFTKGQMRGSGVIANNAHAILILHRSRPVGNPVDKSKSEVVNGRTIEHLSDVRARILFEKARSGNAIPYAPLVFDRQVDGPKAQYFDEAAERAIEEGILTDFDPGMYTHKGAPIIPVRPYVNPLDSFRY